MLHITYRQLGDPAVALSRCLLLLGSQHASLCQGIVVCMTGFLIEQPAQLLCYRWCCVAAYQGRARFRSVTGISAYAGVAVYNTCLRSVALKKVFLWTALTLIAVHLMQLVLVTGGSSPTNPTI